jgi:hypothetical protein
MGNPTPIISNEATLMGGLVWIRRVHNRTPPDTKATVAAEKTTIKTYIMRLTGSLNLRLTSLTHQPTKQYYATLSFKRVRYKSCSYPRLAFLTTNTKTSKG